VNNNTTKKTQGGSKMKRFISIRNQQIAELVSQTEDQAVLKMENGQEKSISPATLKRWWKEIEEPQTEEITSTDEVVAEAEEITLTEAEIEYVEQDAAVIEEMTQPEENADEQTEADPVIEEEPVAKVEKKAKKPAKKKTVDNPHPLKKVIEDLAAEIGTEVTTATVPTFKSLKVEGKRYGAFTFDDDSVTLWLYSEAIEGLTEFRKINHILDARIKFEEMNDENVSKVKQLVLASLAFTKAKIEAKKTK
jgi:hypothetical protein